jgi:hypothetical protein
MKTIQKQKRVSTAMQVAKLAKISHNTDNSIIICLENFTVIRGKEILNSADIPIMDGSKSWIAAVNEALNEVKQSCSSTESTIFFSVIFKSTI